MKKRPPRPKPLIIEHNTIINCSYCNNIFNILYKFKNGKYCCRSQPADCPTIAIPRIEKLKLSRNFINPDGLSNAKKIADKIAYNKLNTIDENGNNMHTISGMRSAEAKFKKIDENGVNVHSLTAKKYKEFLKTESGIDFINRMKVERRNEMLTLTENGETEATRRARIMVNTKINDIDKNGLNTFERAHWYNKNSGRIDEVYYQSSNEKRFLEQHKRKYGSLTGITRGKAIPYTYNNKQKIYLPDYIFNNTLYEIKSKYTMFGVDNKLLEQNLSKVYAAQTQGYVVILVIDDVEYSLIEFNTKFIDK